MTVAFSLSLFGFILSLGKLLYGCITDRVGSYHSNFLFDSFVIIGQILCCFAYTRNNVILFSSMILRGLGLPLTTVGYSMWATAFSDSHSYGVVIQRIQLLYCLSSLVFMPFPGILAAILLLISVMHFSVLSPSQESREFIIIIAKNKSEQTKRERFGAPSVRKVPQSGSCI